MAIVKIDRQPGAGKGGGPVLLLKAKAAFAEVLNTRVLASITVDTDQEVRWHTLAATLAIVLADRKRKKIDQLLVTIGTSVSVDKRQSRQSRDGRTINEIFAATGGAFFAEDRHGRYPPLKGRTRPIQNKAIGTFLQETLHILKSIACLIVYIGGAGKGGHAYPLIIADTGYGAHLGSH